VHAHCGCIIERDMRDGLLLKLKKASTGTVARNASEWTGCETVCNYVLVLHLTLHIFSQHCFTCCNNRKKAITSCGAFINKSIYTAQLKLSLLTPGLIKYESHMRIYRTRYQISTATLIFSVASVTPCKLTYLVCSCKNCREINITLKWLFKQDIFNNIHKKWPFTHISQSFFMTEHIVSLHNTLQIC